VSEDRTRIEAPVCLVCALTYGEGRFCEEALRRLEGRFGPVSRIMEPFDFRHTRYYEREMGGGLKKRLAAFRRPVPPSGLPRAKRAAGEIEARLADPDRGGRRVNLDPGYLAPSRLVLASTKDFAHRIYLDRGIFAEVTLVYRDGRFRPLPWTYPDYREEAVLEFLRETRSAFLDSLRGTTPPSAPVPPGRPGGETP